MSLVTSLDQLIQIQTSMDDKANILVVETLAAHPLHTPDLSPRPIKLIDASTDKLCDECGDPALTVRDQKTGLTIPECRGCINAIRRQSLHHRQYGGSEICYCCEISYDSVGLISGAIHRTWPVEDVGDILALSDPHHNRCGLTTLIAAGKIDLSHDVVTISP